MKAYMRFVIAALVAVAAGPFLAATAWAQTGGIRAGEWYTLGPGHARQGQQGNFAGKWYSSFKMTLKAGTIYTFDMKSKEIDSYLMIMDAAHTRILTRDDDSGGGRDARIINFDPRDYHGTAEYYVVVTSFAQNETGRYYFQHDERPIPGGGGQHPVQITNHTLHANGGRLTEFRPGHHGKWVQWTVKDRGRYRIDLVSQRGQGWFDPYLMVVNNARFVEAQNDDGAGDLNSRVEYDFEPGTYWILLTTYSRDAFGDAELRIQKR